MQGEAGLTSCCKSGSHHRFGSRTSSIPLSATLKQASAAPFGSSCCYSNCSALSSIFNSQPFPLQSTLSPPQISNTVALQIPHHPSFGSAGRPAPGYLQRLQTLLHPLGLFIRSFSTPFIAWIPPSALLFCPIASLCRINPPCPVSRTVHP